MQKILKIIGVLAVTLVVLLVALAIALPLLFDLNDYKDRIAAGVEAETGRALAIEGDLELTIFPWLGVRSGAMSLAQRPGFGDEPFAAFEEAAMRVRLVPLLLRREVEVGRIGLRGLRIQLERDADGNDNWSDLADADERPAEPAVPPDADPMRGLERIRIAGVALEDARIAYRDARAGTSYVVEGLNLTTGALRLGQPVELNLEARVSSAVPQWRGDVGFSGRLDFEHEAQRVSLAAERVTADLEGGVLPVERLRAVVAGHIDGDLRAGTWALERLRVEVTARGGRLPDRDSVLRLEGAARADLAAQTLAFGPLKFDGLGVSGEAQGRGTGIVDAPVLSGRAVVQAFSPRRLLADLAREVPETADPAVLTHLEFAAAFEATGRSLSLSDLAARLDDTSLGGHFAIADFERQALRFDLRVDRVDLDRYLPPDTPQPEDVAPGALDRIEIPERLVRELDVDGSLRIDSLRATGIASEDVGMTIRAQDGLLRVNPATARLYGGTYTGDVSLDVRRDVPRLSMNERLTGIQSGALFKDLFGEERITGTADLSARLTGDGTTVGQMRRTLDGRVAFAFRDGAVQGFDLWHMIRDARAVLRREQRPAKTGPDETRFGSLSGSGVVARGVMTNDDLVAQLPFMRVTGRGQVDLAGETLDYRLRATIQGTPGVEPGSAETELQGLTVPVLISGPFDELNYRVDVGSVLKEELRERIEDRLREQLRRRIGR